MSAAIHPIVMPKLGLSMTEGMVAEWHVQPGSNVSPGQPIADIETSKITNELEAHVSGIVRRTIVETGVEVPVGTLLAVVAAEEVPDAAIDGFIGAFVPDDGEEAVPEAVSDSGVAAPAAESPSVATVLLGAYDQGQVFATHHAHKLAARLGIDLTQVTGSGRRGRISRRDVEQAVGSSGGEDFVATPRARRLARRKGLDLSRVQPTGSRERITLADVERAVSANRAVEPAAPDHGDNPYEERPLTSVQRVAAQRLGDSKRSAPHFRLNMEVRLDGLLQMRQRLNEVDGEPPISVNDVLVKAAAAALAQHPEVNIQFDGDVVRRFEYADIAVAVASERGLLTPVIRRADQKPLGEVAAELADLVDRARLGKLSPDELEGGTFTVSNLGMFGITSFDAIINPPQAAILAVGSAQQRAVFETSEARPASFATLTLSCDHRVIDGATGARFLGTLKGCLEDPAGLAS